METGYISAFWFIAVAAITVPLMLGVGAMLRPKGITTKKGTQAYECGEDPVGSAWIKFNIRFYVVAIIFIIFDVEAAAIFPAATQFREAVLSGNAGFVFAELFLFVALLVLGLIYCWVRGDLEWVKGVGGKKNGR